MILLKFGYGDKWPKKGIIAIKIKSEGIKTKFVAITPSGTPRK
jgi:hypothetical protein